MNPAPMDWLSLTLLCAFSLASADALTKRYLADYTALELSVIRFVFTGLLLAPLLFIQPIPSLPRAFWGWLAALLPLEILAMLLYMRAIRSSPLAQTLPYLAFTPVFSTLTGFMLLGERVSLPAFTGILLVALGAYCLNLDRIIVAEGRRSLLSPLKAMVQETGAQLMLGVAALYSITSVLGKGALRYMPPAFFGPFYFCVLGLCTLVILFPKQPNILGLLWRRPGPHLLIGVMMAVSIVTHFLAIQRVEVASMIAVKRTSLLFGIVYGAFLFKEPHMMQHLLAGALMVLGVFLIAG